MVMSDLSNRVRFDPTINLGHVLTATAFLVSTIAAWISLNARVEQAAKDVARIEITGRTETGRIEVELARRIVETRQYVDSTQVRTADDIREMKTMMRDAFRELDTKLDRKVDKPGR